jgi:hypothetical protein
VSKVRLTAGAKHVRPAKPLQAPVQHPTPSNRPAQRVAGYSVDRIDVAAGLRELKACGYSEPRTVMVIEHALMRWARGEEEAAQRGAIDRGFHGVNLTTWVRVLAAARAHAETAAAKEG